jgi:uncharacterized protein (TIGR03083 family)
MTLSRSVVVPGLITQYDSFAELLDRLSPEEWETQSRCDGWRVADVAAHVVGTLTDVTALQLDGLGTPEVTARQVDERRGRTAGQLADELRTGAKAAAELADGFDENAFNAEGPQGNGQTLGYGLEALWFDTYLHGDDILAALGRTNPSTSGFAPSVSHITDTLSHEGAAPATVRLNGLAEFHVSGGDEDKLIEGDPMQFILVSTGRADPATMGLEPEINIYR